MLPLLPRAGVGPQAGVEPLVGVVHQFSHLGPARLGGLDVLPDRYRGCRGGGGGLGSFCSMLRKASHEL